MCIMLSIDIVTAIRGNIIWTVRRWILCREKKLKFHSCDTMKYINYYCESHYEQHSHIDQTCLMGQVCFNLSINKRIRIGLRVLEEEENK